VLPARAHEIQAQNLPNNLDIAIGGTIQIQGQLSDPEFAESHIFTLEDWTKLDVRLETAGGDVSMVLWHLSTDEQIAAPGDYVVASLGKAGGSSDTKRLTLRSGRYAIVVVRQSGAARVYMLTVKASRSKKPEDPVIIDLDAIDGDPAIVNDWIGADEEERQYLITTVQPAQLDISLMPSDATVSIALHAVDSGTLLGSTTASATAAGEFHGFVGQGTYRISVSAPGQEVSYGLTVFTVSQ